MKRIISLLFLSVYFSFSFLNAQFWMEAFSDGIPPDWTNEDVSMNGVLWEYCDDPFDCPPASLPVQFLEEPRFMSPSALTGYVYVKSFGTGNHVSALTTAAIDCSFATQKVVLKFETHIAVGLSPPNETAIVRVKNSGSDWVTFNVFGNLGILPEEDTESCNPEIIFLDITSMAAGQAEVFIQWQWTADNDLSWALDDIALFDYHPLEERVVWGFQPGEGDFNLGLNDWTVNSILDTCKWYWDPVGWVGNSIFNSVPDDLKICSKTGNDGAAVIHPEACFVEGGGNQPPPVICELISPIIDLSGFTNGSGLILEFDQLVALGNPVNPVFPVTGLSYSLNGGQTWQDTLDANPDVCFGFSNFENSTFRYGLPPEVLGTDSFRLRFAFAGDLFWWVIDDVRILERWDNDMKVNENFVAIPPNFKTPVNQLEPFGLLADVENFGNLLQEEVRLLATIINENNVAVHIDTLFFGTLMPGELLENIPFEKLVTLPPAVGKYIGTYRIESLNEDEYPSNNEINFSFEITENTFAKENGGCKGTGFKPDNDFLYEIGNCFFVPNGDSILATHVTFGIGNPGQLDGETILTRLYQWKTDSTFADENGNFFANEWEYEEIAINSFVVDGQADGLVTLPIDFEQDCIPLEDSTYYFVTVSYENASPTQTLFISASEKLDYNATFFLSHELDKGIRRYFPMLRVGDEKNFSSAGFGLDRIPVVRLHTIHESEKVYAFEGFLPKLKMELFPNPTSGQLFLTLPSDEFQREAKVEILDISGKLVKSRQFENIFVKQLPINVAELPEGSYILRLVVVNGTAFGSFVIAQ